MRLAYSGTRHWERLQVFLLLAALALYVLWLRGQAAELTEQHWHSQANTVRQRTVLSTTCIGFQVRGDSRVTVRKDHIHAAASALRELRQTPMSDY